MSENHSHVAEAKPYPPRRAPEHAHTGENHGEGGGGMQGLEVEEDHEGALETEGFDADIHGEPGHIGVMVPQVGSNQLTLSFQGEVYVFDSVSPEKVQAVLLLLGGREIAGTFNCNPSSSHQYNRRSNFPQRVASLMRFREKRKERNFDKKIRYNVRKEVALRMQRNKGQFTSSKSKPQDAAAGSNNWDATQRWDTDDRPPAAAACHHCGISASATPMMRRGPSGPRSLCNACGLMWANKGTLRDLSKSATPPSHTALPQQEEGNGPARTVMEKQPNTIATNGHDSSSKVV